MHRSIAYTRESVVFTNIVNRLLCHRFVLVRALVHNRLRRPEAALNHLYSNSFGVGKQLHRRLTNAFVCCFVECCWNSSIFRRSKYNKTIVTNGYTQPIKTNLVDLFVNDTPWLSWLSLLSCARRLRIITSAMTPPIDNNNNTPPIDANTIVNKLLSSSSGVVEFIGPCDNIVVVVVAVDVANDVDPVSELVAFDFVVVGVLTSGSFVFVVCVGAVVVVVVLSVVGCNETGSPNING
jgi:hypothetical protein